MQLHIVFGVSRVKSSRFLTTDLKSIFTDWLEMTWNDLKRLHSTWQMGAILQCFYVKSRPVFKVCVQKFIWRNFLSVTMILSLLRTVWKLQNGSLALKTYMINWFHEKFESGGKSLSTLCTSVHFVYLYEKQVLTNISWRQFAV